MFSLNFEGKKRKKEGEEGRKKGHFYTFKGRVKGVVAQYEKDVKATLLCLAQKRP